MHIETGDEASAAASTASGTAAGVNKYFSVPAHTPLIFAYVHLHIYCTRIYLFPCEQLKRLRLCVMLLL